jgi:hypothetical protein
MTIKKFIEDNFLMYQDKEHWGTKYRYFTPISDMGQLCIEYTPNNIEPYMVYEGIPLYTKVEGIVHVLNTFYGMNTSTDTILDVIWRGKKVIRFES